MINIGQYRVVARPHCLLAAPEAGAAAPARDHQPRTRWRPAAAPYKPYDLNRIGANAAAAAIDGPPPTGILLNQKVLEQMGRIKPNLHFAVAVSGLGNLDCSPPNPAGNCIQLTFQSEKGSKETAVTIVLHRQIGRKQRSMTYQCALPSSTKIFFRAHVMAKRALISWLDGRPAAQLEMCEANQANSRCHQLAKSFCTRWTAGDLILNMDMGNPWEEKTVASSPPPAAAAPAAQALPPSIIWRPF
jgi:hypothetical protein